MLDTPRLPTLPVIAQFICLRGRPPNCLSDVVLPQPPKRACLSALQEDSRVSKKAKDNNPIIDSPHAFISFKDGNHASIMPDVAMDDSRSAPCLRDLQQHNKVSMDGSVTGKLSYANMAARHPNHTEKSSDSSNFLGDDIVVLEDDYVIDHSGKIHSIKFSNRVHEQIDHSMRNTKIVHQLGRNIIFKTLHTRLLTLWKLIGNIQ
ncbi:hypothetical protein GQ457_04G013710 [Hibiscus cannabinus]